MPGAHCQGMVLNMINAYRPLNIVWSQLDDKNREYEETVVQMAELTASLDHSTAIQREEALQHELDARNQQQQVERLRQQLGASHAEHKKLLADFEEFKIKARTVLKQKQEAEQPTEDVAVLKSAVCHLITPLFVY